MCVQDQGTCCSAKLIDLLTLGTNKKTKLESKSNRGKQERLATAGVNFTMTQFFKRRNDREVQLREGRGVQQALVMSGHNFANKDVIRNRNQFHQQMELKLYTFEVNFKS